MKFGLQFSNTMHFAGREGLVTLAQGAEAAGFESAWTVEHVIFPDAYESAYPYDASGKMPMAPDTPLPDPLIWLTWAAAVTERLHLGTGILILPQRNPVVLAKEAGHPRRPRPAVGWSWASASGGWRRSSTPSASPSPGAGPGPTTTWRPCAPSGTATRPPTRASSAPSPGPA